MRLLDLFCGAGGAAVGYHRAGFTEIVGVDIAPQPRYPFAFVQASALEFLAGVKPGEYDLIHASPPCQGFSDMKWMPTAKAYPDLLTPCRDGLLRIGTRYVIENVEGAPIKVGPPNLFSSICGVVLCGSMFDLVAGEYELRRHRLFESTSWLPQPRCQHSGRGVIGFYGDHARRRRRSAGGGDITGRERKLALVRDLMGIDWMEWDEARQAIPPAYTEWIGLQLIGVAQDAERSRIPAYEVPGGRL